MKDQGVAVSCQQQWTRYIKEITEKANRTLGLVKRICRDVHDVRTRKLLHCSLVRPQSLSSLSLRMLLTRLVTQT